MLLLHAAGAAGGARGAAALPCCPFLLSSNKSLRTPPCNGAGMPMLRVSF
jgi:hypothetical protein